VLAWAGRHGGAGWDRVGCGCMAGQFHFLMSVHHLISTASPCAWGTSLRGCPRAANNLCRWHTGNGIGRSSLCCSSPGWHRPPGSGSPPPGPLASAASRSDARAARSLAPTPGSDLAGASHSPNTQEITSNGNFFRILYSS
jgi:hypothetical protein